jgi:hypothetical protein
VTTLKSSVEQKIFFGGENTTQQAPKNKYQCLLADPPEIDISKISEDANKKKKSNRRLFPQLPSHEKGADKICKVWSLGHSSRVWARIA